VPCAPSAIRIPISRAADVISHDAIEAHSRQLRCPTSEDRGQKGDQPRLNSPLNFRRDFITDFPLSMIFSG
jgi:hypothetical protein